MKSTADGIEMNGRKVAWAVLLDAATQEDLDLRRAYAAILDQAAAQVAGRRDIPARAYVAQDETRVWWRAYFLDPASRDSYPRRAAEGGTLSTREMAEQEMVERAEYLRSLGYTVEDAE